MGLSASQARFLQLTARKSNVEYEAQQISFQRLQLADKEAAASTKYQDATSNRKMVFTFNTGSEIAKVDISYSNYKNYMNQQLDGLSTSQDKYYLVSSSGNKVVVSSEAERDEMIEKNTKLIALEDIENAKAQVAQAEIDGDSSSISDYTKSLAKMDLSSYESRIEGEGEDAKEYYVQKTFDKNDFFIAENLDVDSFQRAIQEGTYYFAKFEENSETHEQELKTQAWETLGNGAIIEEYDKSDDAQAEAEYKATQDKLQNTDKRLELRLNQLESERSAIETELESVQKVIDDNIEGTFNTFS